MVHEQAEQVGVDLDEAVDDVDVQRDDLDLVRHGNDHTPGTERARHARRRVLDGDAAGRVDTEGRGRGEVRRGVWLRLGYVVAAHHRIEIVLAQGPQRYLHEGATGIGDQSG